ncbi:uncharacterized protein CTRU02_207514 [Colletotrichum truncatum]|uniref:Uncharacterized protein n=1 Tax=Colletotrichum truncatum TaxID=5467 RepID=A0ACC3Z112_COLTU|nr:uncharacterized protein CTRU02_15810 [Colletotrichum truncatum]XP_036588807.1 uncharacterized protein CTRU02_00854 [Colletotrichum truncatum]KAF6780625.1 hypothetical protein CTRU02_15810 [Colletotrichum truncatum]KAF6800449.1 hypothetical protein CTRU02_00854 [Colletotrichum truncatum]
MSGTAPNNPAPGGHASGLEQTSLDSNQHGQTQNIIDETKDTHGSTTVDRNVGDAIDASKSKAGLSSRVDDLLDKTSAAGSGTAGAERKGAAVAEKGFRVGEEADLHDLASSKQP